MKTLKKRLEKGKRRMTLHHPEAHLLLPSDLSQYQKLEIKVCLKKLVVLILIVFLLSFIYLLVCFKTNSEKSS